MPNSRLDDLIEIEADWASEELRPCDEGDGIYYLDEEIVIFMFGSSIRRGLTPLIESSISIIDSTIDFIWDAVQE